MIKYLNTIPRYFGCILCLLIVPVSAAYAQPEDERQFLLMYFTEEELVVESPTRSPKPVSQVAENVTVVTAEDIQFMNAHTLADVLNTITGVQVFMTSGPGSSTVAFIQGSDQRHVAVFLDGIPLNNLGDNVTDLGTIPVQNIEKIEIIKGPASSAWGSSLGGVVNIITKSGRSGTSPGGVVTASYGKQNTGDFRAEVFGKQGALGYYLNAGRLETDGLTPNFDVANNNAYAKLNYDLANSTGVQLTLNYNGSDRGSGDIPDFDLSSADEVRSLRSTLALMTAIGKDADLRFSLWSSRQRIYQSSYQLSTGSLLYLDNYTDEGSGSTAELTWRGRAQTVVFGADFDSKTLESNRISGGAQALRRAAAYLNDTVSFADFSVTPGIRYDNTNTNGDFTSPSLGMTYKLTETTVLRLYGARGFNVPPLVYTYGDNQFIIANPDLKMERVKSYQAGIETAALKHFWLKLSGFRHEIRDAISTENISPLVFKAVNSERQRRMGVEFELKTAPVYHASFFAGAAYVNARDLNSDQTILNVPKFTCDLGLVYDDERSLKAMLTGRYVNWNADPGFQGNYGNFVFDLNVTDVISRKRASSLDAFLTAHNLFNGSQYFINAYKNPERWVEAGMRYKF